MSNYRVFIAADVIAGLRILPRADQSRITRVFDELARGPFRIGDYAEQDNIGRPIQVLVVGRYAIFYWADHPAKEVKITDLKAAGS